MLSDHSERRRAVSEFDPVHNAVFRFGDFEVKKSSYELLRAGERVKIERIPMDLLILLVENRGDLVSRDQIIERLWGNDVFLETEHSINTAINKLRSILHDHPKDPAFIQTVVGKGYRFIAEVAVIEYSYHGPTSPDAAPTSPGPVSVPEAVPEDLLESPATHAAANAPHDSGASPVALDPAVHPPAPYITALPSPKQAAPPRMGMTLHRTAAALVFAAVASLVIFAVRNRKAGPEQAATPLHAVAVLPFSDLSGGSGQDYLVDGMTDEVITLLARSNSLRVISRRSTMQYKGVQKPLAQIAAALNVDAVVEGSVMRSGKTVRITAQLLDAKNDQHLWAETYRDSGDEPLANQDRVAADIARQVALKLTRQSLATNDQPIDPRARDFYLRGRYLWNTRTLAGLERSIDYYKRAIEIEPKFAAAYAGLGQASVLLSSYGGPDPTRPLLEARSAAEKALEIDPRLGEAHTVLAAVEVDLDWNWKAAEVEFKQAVELNPGDPTAHHWYALHLARLRRFPEAQQEMRMALDLDPLSVIIQTDAAEVAYYAHKPVEAEAAVLRALELDPNFAEAHSVLGKVYEMKGQFKNALVEAQRAAQLFGQEPNSVALLGHALALSGQRGEATKISQSLEAASTQRYVSGVDIAVVDCALGNTDGAMRWLERGYRNRDKGMNVLGAEPLFDGCRSDKSFQNLLDRMKL